MLGHFERMDGTQFIEGPLKQYPDTTHRFVYNRQPGLSNSNRRQPGVSTPNFNKTTLAI